MTRSAAWQADLSAFLELNQYRKFQYGEWDCCLFVCDAVQVMTGVDLAEWFRGTYCDRQSAIARMREFCGKASLLSVVRDIARAHEMTACKVLQARRGDVVLVKRASRVSLGMVAMNGKDVIVASRKGLWRMHMSEALRAWHV